VALRSKVLEAVHKACPEMTEAQLLEYLDRGAYEGGAKGRFFALDPIDGTKGFLRNDQYAIALALIEDGQVVVGVLDCPNLPWSLKNHADGHVGSGFVAIKGQGTKTFMLGDPEDKGVAKVSTHPTVEGAHVLESVESGHTAHDLSAIVAERLKFSPESVRMDSQAKYGCLARGDGEVYLRLPKPGKRYEEKIWDHAAGMLVVEEAGGKVTDIYGKPLDFSRGRTLEQNTGVVGTNGPIHDTVIAALAQAQ